MLVSDSHQSPQVHVAPQQQHQLQQQQQQQQQQRNNFVQQQQQPAASAMSLFEGLSLASNHQVWIVALRGFSHMQVHACKRTAIYRAAFLCHVTLSAALLLTLPRSSF